MSPLRIRRGFPVKSAGWPYAMVFREHLVSRGNMPDTSMAYANNAMNPPKE